MTDAPERIWAKQTSGWGDLERGVYQSAEVDGDVEYTRADLAKPRVKPLVWDGIRTTGDREVYAQDADTEIGHYIAASDGVDGSFFIVGYGGYNRLTGNLEAAKAAAQADYEARVLACLKSAKP